MAATPNLDAIAKAFAAARSDFDLRNIPFSQQQGAVLELAAERTVVQKRLDAAEAAITQLQATLATRG